MRPQIGNPDCTCHEQHCYSCRRYAIDERALAIYDREVKYCTGMTGFDIEEHAARMALRYRDDAVNQLAFEL